MDVTSCTFCVTPVRIPLKAIGHSGGNPITVPGGTDQASEQSDAGTLMLPRLIGIVKRKSDRSETEAEWSWRGWGRGARGSSPLPRLSTQFPRSASSAPVCTRSISRNAFFEGLNAARHTFIVEWPPRIVGQMEAHSLLRDVEVYCESMGNPGCSLQRRC